MIFTQIDRANNMDVVRYYLCLCIIINHFNVLNESSLPNLPRIFDEVGCFFAISGFLMFASFEKRPGIKQYFVHRLRRILPPYILIVLLATFGLSCLSTLPLYDYFTSPGLYKYLVSNLLFMNFLAPSLPGVFSSGLNHLDVVNASLWTMKGEMVCYLAVPAIYFFLKKYPKYAPHILSAFVLICLSAYVGLSLYDYGSENIVPVVAKQFRLLTFFFIGVLLNIGLKYVLKYKWQVVVVASLLLYLSTHGTLLYLLLRPFTDSVLVIWLCFVGSWGHYFSRYDSVSYDMYLFHFPIIQVLIAIGTVNAVGLWCTLAIALSLTVLMSIASWRYIGKPILKGAPLFCVNNPKCRLPR